MSDVGVLGTPAVGDGLLSVHHKHIRTLFHIRLKERESSLYILPSTKADYSCCVDANPSEQASGPPGSSIAGKRYTSPCLCRPGRCWE